MIERIIKELDGRDNKTISVIKLSEYSYQIAITIGGDEPLGLKPERLHICINENWINELISVLTEVKKEVVERNE